MRPCVRIMFVVLAAVSLSACNKTSSSGTSPTSPSTPTGAVPTVTAISPQSGPSEGGVTVTITGTGFTGASKVSFGSAISAAFTVQSDTSIAATSPAAAAGTLADISVTTAAGTSAITSADLFSWGQNGITGIVLSANAVTAGTPVTVTVNFAFQVPDATAIPITWTSNPPNPTAASFPQHVTVPASKSSAVFQVPTYFVSSPHEIVFNATYSGAVTRSSFVINPPQ